LISAKSLVDGHDTPRSAGRDLPFNKLRAVPFDKLRTVLRSRTSRALLRWAGRLIDQTAWQNALFSRRCSKPFAPSWRTRRICRERLIDPCEVDCCPSSHTSICEQEAALRHAQDAALPTRSGQEPCMPRLVIEGRIRRRWETAKRLIAARKVTASSQDCRQVYLGLA
jgi:hypothetical protein